MKNEQSAMNGAYKMGGTGTLFKIAFRNIGRNKRRTAFCLIAVAIAVFFLPVYSSLIDGMLKSINDVVQIFESGQVNVVTKQYEAEKEYMPVQYPVANGRNWREVAAEIKSIPGVRTVLPRISTMATLQDGSIKHATLWGLDIEAEREAHHLNLTERSDGLVRGRWPLDANECAVGIVFENKTGMTIGDRVQLKTISAQFSDKMWSPVITGIFNFDYIKLDERYIVVDHERLQRLLVLDEGTQSLFVYADKENFSPMITARVQNLLGDDHTVSDWQENYWVAMMKMVTPTYTIIFLIFFIVASFLIVNTVVMIVNERIKEIGMMGSLGMTRVEIVSVFFFESVILAVIGAIIGVFLGGGTVAIMQNFPFRMVEMYGDQFSEMPLSNTIFFVFDIGRLLQAFLMGVIVASVFTLFPSLRSARVEPVEALRR
jgi:putative ABC transport system permease protein